MTDYRTSDQFDEIETSMLNGNWTQAGQECVDYGFYANDLHIAHDTAVAEGRYTPDDIWDYVELIEIANKIRGTK